MKEIASFFLLISIGFSIPAKAQANNFEINVIGLLATWNDSTRPVEDRLIAVDSLSEYVYLNSNPDSSYYYAQLQYELAKATGHTNWMIEGLYNLGWVCKYRGESDSALAYFDQVLGLSERHGYKRGAGLAYYGKGSISSNKGEWDQAMEHYQKTYEIGEAIGDKEVLLFGVRSLGVGYKRKGMYPEAMEYFTKGLAASEGASFESGLLTEIGLMLMEQGDYDGAIKNFLKSIETNGSNQYMNGFRLQVIGNAYKLSGNGTKAIEYYLKSIALNEELGLENNSVGSFLNLGSVYAKRGEYALAIKYLEKSQMIFETGNWPPSGLATVFVERAGIHAARGEYKMANEKATQALSLIQDIEGELANISNIYERLLGVYKTIGAYREALEMYEVYHEIQDSLNSKANQTALIRQQLKADYEKQVAIETQKKKDQQKISIAIGIGLLLTTILAIGIFNRLKVTRRQKAIIEEQKVRVEQSERYKEQFLANMSHEIRTPMHAISGMVKILERNEHPPTQNAYLKAMHASADNLLVILNDILDLSKVEAGKLEIENLPMQVEDVLENVQQVLQYKAEEKGLNFQVEIGPDVPEWIVGDPTRLSQVLTNLAGNAIKFTEKGSVDLSVHRKNDFLVYEVRDTGIGIPPDRLGNIFEAFEQADESTARRYGGTGLGLNISRQLVELQGGNVWAESVEGQGSSFFVSLPLIPVDASSQPVRKLSQHQFESMATALKGTRILLAEDNEFNQMILQDDLNFYVGDISIDVAEDGSIAWEKFQQGAYDLVLMDVQMPEMDGYETTLKIREWEKAQNKAPIPIIAMTASLLKSEVNLCFEAGMNNYIPKPYEIDDLIGRIYEEVKA